MHTVSLYILDTCAVDDAALAALSHILQVTFNKQRIVLLEKSVMQGPEHFLLCL